MKINKILYVEDNPIKYASVERFLRGLGYANVSQAFDSNEAFELLKEECFDLIILDMHFKYDGIDDHAAGEKTMKQIRDSGIDTPIVFCSSRNWKIPGSLGNIFYNERRDWESEARELFQNLIDK